MTYFILYFLIGIVITTLVTQTIPNEPLNELGGLGVFLWISFMTFLWPLFFILMFIQYFKD